MHRQLLYGNRGILKQLFDFILVALSMLVLDRLE